ncbi:MAG: hypothetical protein AB7I59_01150 [Geminicoccaceae bacterium]
MAVAMLVTFAQPAEAAGWRSGVRNNNTTNSFATWRGSSLGVVSGWIDWKHGWSGMYSYASGTQPRALRAKSSNVSFGHGLFPKGGNLAACAKGDYDDEQREVARRLSNNGAGSAEIRLGWEASGDWFPWSAVGKPAEQWKTCFTRVAKAMKSAAPGLRIGWFMAKKGRIDVRAIYPAGAPITNIGISHYDDPQARFGNETFKGGPWGLRAWVQFARSKGKKFAIGEWGVGRRGDNPKYIEQMHDFLQWAGGSIAHEAYFNTGKYQLYPTNRLRKSAEAYRRLF